MPRRRTPPPGETVADTAADPAASDTGAFDMGGPSTRTAEPVAGAYAAALKSGFEATAGQVQQMHQAIAGQVFAALAPLPVISHPARWVQAVHDTVSAGVHAAVRHTGAAVLGLAGEAEQRLSDPQRVPGPREQAVRSALNGVAGDALQARANPLAISMGLHADGKPLTPAAMTALGRRVCVLVHGLACDERSWGLHPEAWTDEGTGPDYATLLTRDFGASVVFVRYNSGLAIGDNALALSGLLAALVASTHPCEIVLIGHSMGGLVARGACEHAAASHQPWLDSTRMLVCLGTPHRGAPLERLGQAVSAALSWSAMTRPLSHLAGARSQGIRDLHDGAPPVALPLPMRLVAGLDDALVRRDSANDDDLQGDVERIELAGLGHMDLLNHPKAYAAIRGWLRSIWP